TAMKSGGWAGAALGAMTIGSMLTIASCGGSTPRSIPSVTTIKLAQSPWDASRINVEIARVLLEEQMGYQVEVTELDEYSQWPPIAAGALRASLEVWPSGHHADVAQYVKTGQIEDGGLLGPIGKIGWYIPSYVLTQHPELTDWRGFRSQAAVDLF